MERPGGRRHPVGAAGFFLAAAIFLSPALAPPLLAHIYTYTDEKGDVHFSNSPVDSRYRVYIREEEPAPTAPRLPVNKPKEERWDEHIFSCALRHDVEPAFLKAVMKVESDFNPVATSVDGALGLMQLMPETAEDLGVRNPFNPRDNIDGAARHLSRLVRHFGTLPLAAAAYNAGENAVAKYGGVPPYAETRKYVNDVIREYEAYRRNGFGTGTGEKPHDIQSPPAEEIRAVRRADGVLVFTNQPWLYQGKSR